MIGGLRGDAARNESSRGERDNAQLMGLHGVSPWPFNAWRWRALFLPNLRRQMANPAGLGEDLPAQFLRGGQSVVGGGLLRRGTPCRQHAQENGRANGRANRGTARHLESSRHPFFCKPTPAQCQAEALTQNRAA
jgi:hypothetical protein